MTAPLRREPVRSEERTPAHAVRLRRLNRWQAENLREDLADLYVESTRVPAGQEYRSRKAFLRRLTGDIRRAGFALLVAEDTALAGCVYGFPVPREGTWWRGFDGPLPQSVEQLTASGHVFAITEIVVHPHTDDQGLARRLQQALLADHHASLGATLVDEADTRSYDAFLSWGWRDIGALRRPSDPTTLRPPAPVLLRALVLPLGQPLATRPDGLAHENRTQRPD
ncbi:GNAT family N-acetyltransferase [Streptomyces sp. NPDC001260]|uniref:GNAT family N-acetyltransferase n=1 Tax=Streptomyces sp. NPDC001260 TaxID=3364551 RepID=UPI0036AEFCA3